jgi:ubiquinone/menaquinone biosynthesis C-methylase UbiE
MGATEDSAARRVPAGEKPEDSAGRGTSSHFGELAARYDELRAVVPEHRKQVYELLVVAGDLRGRRVLDVGCGTGTLAAWLAERAAAQVWGVDPSAEMLAVARAKLPPGIGLKQGRAEDLPFKDRSFERVVLTLVVHHLDRLRAFAECRRVLGGGGRLVLATFAPEQFDRYYLNAFFPSIGAIDRERFGTLDQLAAELNAAAFSGVAAARLDQQTELSRETVLERVRGRNISTFQLISDDEYAAGLERIERELPQRVRVYQHWLVVSAESP